MLCGLLLLGALSFPLRAVAQNYDSGSDSGNSGNYSPANLQPQQLSPQEPGSGGSSQPQASGKTPTTQNKVPSQAKPKVYTRVPARSRL